MGSRVMHGWMALSLTGVSLVAMLLSPGFAQGKAGDGDLGAGEHRLVDKAAASRIDRARKYAEQGDDREAVIVLKALLQDQPDIAEARALLGKVALDIGDPRSAAKEMRRALELGLPAPDAAETLARAYLAMGEYTQVLEQVPVPQDADVRLRATVLALRGLAELELGDADQARSDFQQALEADAATVDGHLGMVKLALASSDLPEAERWVSEGLEVAPDNAALWSARGALALATNQLDQARSAFAVAVDLAPDDSSAQIGLAEALLKAGDVAAAREVFDRIDPQSGELSAMSYLRGSFAVAAEDFQTAVNELESFLAVQPDNPRALQFLAYSQFKLGRTEQARRTIERYLNRYPPTSPLLQLLAAVRLSLGEPAEDLLAPLLADNPDDPQLLALRARSLKLQGDEAGAAALLQQQARLVAASDVQSADPRAQPRSPAASEGSEAGESGTETLSELVERAARHLSAGRRADARVVIHDLQTSHPDKGIVWQLSGVLAAGDGDIRGAEAAFKRALELEPDNASALRNLAELEVKARRNVEQAREYYRQALAKEPDHLHTLLTLADLDRVAGDIGAEMAHLSRALELRPDAVEPRVRIARMDLARGNPQSALAVLDAAPSEIRNAPAYLKARGETLTALGDHGHAAETFEMLTEIAPGDADGYYALAFARGALGEQEPMKQALLRALSMAPDAQAANELIVRLVSLASTSARARVLVDELKAVAPGHPQVLLLDAQLALEAGDAATATSLYRDAVARHPDVGALMRGLARAEREAGDAKAATATLTRRVADAPDDLIARRMLASLALEAGDSAEAEGQYRAIVAAEPDDASVLNNLAWLIREGDPEAALEYSQRAAELRPADPAILDTLGVLLLEQGQPRKAAEVLRRAYSFDPADPTIAYHRAQASAAAGETAGAVVLLEEALTGPVAFPERSEAEALLRSLKDQ